MVLPLTFTSMIRFELVFRYVARKGSNFILFACGYPIVLASFLEKILSPLNYFGILVESHLTIT